MSGLAVLVNLDGLRSFDVWEANQTNLQKIRPFISAVDLTIPSGPSEDLQSHESDAAKIYGRITIPILAQNDTFTEDNKNWNALEAFAPTLEKLLCMTSKVLRKDLEENHPRPQGRTRNDYEAALEICQRALPADQGGMPFSDEIRSVNCFSHVRISANISMGNPWEKLKPDTDTGACGPCVMIVPWGQWSVVGDWIYGGRMATPHDKNQGLYPGSSFQVRKEMYVYNTPYSPVPGSERYQIEFFMPHLPEHNGESYEKSAELSKEVESECPLMRDPDKFGGITHYSAMVCPRCFPSFSSFTWNTPMNGVADGGYYIGLYL
ncbi:hypothetical protein BPOR_0224g00040 [Botrytis porri]|uniref:Uncharacterized protein n=1 Tax=Botrytis porri TaxID=87229 RepID=A0A4Z1KN68_9HELO|nr:hypothetical protein BPOR_0224g00040 [Botrytis porri]